MHNVLRKNQDKQWDNSQGNQVEQTEAGDCWKTSCDKDIDENNIEIKKEIIQITSLKSNLDTICGSSHGHMQKIGPA